MILERTLIYSSYTPYPIYFRMVVSPECGTGKWMIADDVDNYHIEFGEAARPLLGTSFSIHQRSRVHTQVRNGYPRAPM